MTEPQKANFVKKIQKVLEIHEAEVLTFTTNTLAQTMLPHRDPGDVNEYTRTAGRLALTINPLISKGKNWGIPYGSIPRLVLLWLISEAVITNSREVPLGRSLSSFMRNLDLIPTGGKWGTIGRLKKQIVRLFSSRFSFIDSLPQGIELQQFGIADKCYLFWDQVDPNQGSLFESKVILSDVFFKEILRAPVPLDLRIVKILKQSPLALDIYTWLTYRMSYLEKPSAPIPWNLLALQFGSNYEEVKKFKYFFIKTLNKIIQLYPAMTKATEKGLVLLPSKTSISKKSS